MKLTFIFSIFATFSANCAQFENKTVNFQRFAAALAKVESNNNPKAHNIREDARGLLQVRANYFKDAQKFDKELARFGHNDCFNKQVAIRVFYSYCSRYEPLALKNGDWETLARLHNAGWNWKAKRSATNNYWRKVKKALTLI